MDILQLLSVVSYPVLLVILGWSFRKILDRLFAEISDIKADVKELRSDVGEAINNTGIVSEGLLSLEKQCEIRHK